MSDPVSIFGRKPAMPDTGYGEILPNVTYASIMGSISKHARLVRLGGRMGRNYTSNSFVTLAAYTVSNSRPSSRVAQTGQFTVSNVMQNHGQGADIVKPVTSYAKINAGTTLALSISVQGGSAAYGMGEWGHVLHQVNTGVPPSTFNSINSRPEGKMSLWAEIVYNRAPVKPAIVSPKHNSQIVTLRPTLTCKFDDPDITLDQLPGQTCDRMTKYQFEIWTTTSTGAKSSRIYNTGVKTASGAEQTAKAASFTPASNLSAGRYMATCTMWDEFGEPSPRQEWLFTVVSGGAIEDFDLRDDQYIQPGLIAATTNLVGEVTWQSQGGANTATLQVTVRRSSGTVVSGPNGPAAFTVLPGAKGYFNLTGLGHPPLTPGLSYYLEATVVDTMGQTAPTARTPDFRVKGAPPVPTLKRPNHGQGFVDPPTLVGTMGEDDGSTVVNPQFGLRPEGDTEWTTIGVDRLTYEDGDYYLSLGPGDLPTKGDWEWSIRAVDAFGDASAWATPRIFTYADPPTVTLSGVTEGATIDTSRPTLTVTASTTFTHYWYTVFNATTQQTSYTTRPTAVTARTEHTFQIAEALRNTNKYLVTVYVQTAVGIQGMKTLNFTVNYPAPTAVASLSTEVVPGPMESVNEPQWWSRILVKWGAAPSEYPDEVFYGYVLERRNLATGEVELRRVFRSRSQRSFLDATPRSGAQYEYTIYWLRRPDGKNLVLSNPVTVQNGVTLKGATLSSMTDDNLGAPLYAFSDRRPEWGSAEAVTVYETWGELPIAFQSLNRGDVIAGTFVPMDDPYGQYTHMDLVNAVKRMSRPEIAADGTPTPHAVYYRDGRGRAGAYVITGPSGENDRAWLNATELNLTLTEVRVAMVETGP